MPDTPFLRRRGLRATRPVSTSHRGFAITSRICARTIRRPVDLYTSPGSWMQGRGALQAEAPGWLRQAPSFPFSHEDLDKKRRSLEGARCEITEKGMPKGGALTGGVYCSAPSRQLDASLMTRNARYRVDMRVVSCVHVGASRALQGVNRGWEAVFLYGRRQ